MAGLRHPLSSAPQSSRVSRPRSEVGSATYDSYHADDVESDAARRPTQLAITSGDHHSTEFYHGDSHKEGEKNATIEKVS